MIIFHAVFWINFWKGNEYERKKRNIIQLLSIALSSRKSSPLNWKIKNKPDLSNGQLKCWSKCSQCLFLRSTTHKRFYWAIAPSPGLSD